MNEKIRNAIFEFDIFDPWGGNSGRGVDGMVLNSAVLQEYEPTEVVAELAAMLAEGWVADYHGGPGIALPDTWASTPRGRRERQRRLTVRGERAAALSSQDSFDVEDLVLAIVAAAKTSKKFHHDGVRADILPVYLFDRSEPEVEAAVKALVEKCFVREFEVFDTQLYLTVPGLQHYRNVVHARLKLEEGQSILDGPARPIGDARFSQLGIDRELSANLESRWIEAQACMLAGAPLAVVILLGSVLEGLLLAVLGDDLSKTMTAAAAPRDKGTTKALGDWKLREMIDVAAELELISRAASKHSHELRDSRNLVHPHKQLKDKLVVDEDLISISFQVVDAILDSLVKKRGKR